MLGHRGILNAQLVPDILQIPDMRVAKHKTPAANVADDLVIHLYGSV